MLGRGLGSITIAALMSIATAGAAHAGSPPSQDDAAVRHCAVLVSKEPVGPAGRTEVGRACAQDRATAAAEVGATAGTLLLTIYADANYGGYRYHFYGDYGHCDSQGYRINLGLGIRNMTSSMKGYNYCNSAEAYDGPDLTGTRWWYGQPGRYLNVPWVGAGANDRIDSLRVRRW